MNILFLCHRFPFPPRRGGKIRPFHMIQHLAGPHSVTVASLVRSQREAKEGEGIAAYCASAIAGRVSAPVQALRMLARLPTVEPSSMGYFYSASLARRIRDLLRTQQLDLIVVHCSSVAQYVAHVAHIPKILDFGDMDSQKWLEYARYKSWPMSMGYRLEGTKMLHAEKQLARRFDLCTATTRAEWETLESLHSARRTGWFPNGVDGSYFSPVAAPYQADTICFLGRMDYYPNQQCMLEFCRDVLPRLRAHRPNIKLDIVGAAPSLAIRRLADIPGVVVTGQVPDVRPWLHKAALSVAPLNIARGTQNKILEAMAAGIPVVTTPVAAGGVDAVANQHFLVAEGAQSTADAILRVLANPLERERLARAGRARVLSNHDWGHSMHRFDALIETHLGMGPDLGSVSEPRKVAA